MKFLTALMFLVSATAFADVGGKIKCYEAAQQGGDAEVAYVMFEKENKLWLAYPEELRGKLYSKDGCLHLKRYDNETELMAGGMEFCPGEGQEINDLIPVDVYWGQEEETVYCEKDLEEWFEKYPTL